VLSKIITTWLQITNPTIELETEVRAINAQVVYNDVPASGWFDRFLRGTSLPLVELPLVALLLVELLLVDLHSCCHYFALMLTLFRADGVSFAGLLCQGRLRSNEPGVARRTVRSSET
jgi:hypothetical protein